MASAGAHLPPWDRGNVQEGKLFLHSQYKEVLSKSCVTLRDNLRLHDVWPHLHQMGVITQNDEDRMRLNAPNCESVDRLIAFINTCQRWCYHALLRAMALTQQGHLIPQGGLTPEVYLETQQGYLIPQGGLTPEVCLGGAHYTTGEGPQQQSKKSATTEIKEHRDVYNRILMQGSLLDIPSLDLPYNTELTYIQIVATLEERLTKPEGVKWQDILKPKPGKPRLRTVLLSGPAGAGKSSLIRFYAYKWSQQEDGSSDWDLIIILNVSTLQLTEGLSPKDHIKEAIQQSLEGRGDKEAIMKSLDGDDLDILIIPDGMDECRSPTILEMLKELISSCHKGKLGFTVLSTCRSGLSPIRESLYDRCMKLDGFKTHEGVEYVQRFYQEIQKPEDDSIFDYILSNQEDLDHILKNPLCTHILSVVTSDGTLKLVKGKRLKLNDLFKAMEKSMRRRQLEKTLDTSLETPLEVQIKHFYSMSLWALLKDVRTFDDNLLSLFGINMQHPYLTFMKRTRRYNSDLENISYWTFSHEMFNEYFAVCGLEKLPDNLLSALLLAISSDRKFQNTQRILFSALGGSIDQLVKLSGMIGVTLITQTDSDRLDPTIRAVIDDIKEKARTNISLDDVLNFLIPGKENSMIDTSNAQTLWQTIRTLYEDQAGLLQQKGFLRHTVQSSQDLIKHIYDCLHEVPEEHQQKVFAESLGHIMPSTGVDDDGDRHILYNTGGTRWSQVTESSYGDVDVYIRYSLTDAAEAVHQYGQHLVTWRKDEDTTHWGDIRLHLSPGTHQVNVRSIWGDPPHDQLLSTKPWSHLVGNMSQWPGTANTLRLWFGGDFVHGVVGFLQCLQMECTQDALRRLLVQDEGGWLRIVVSGEHIDSESLLAWTDWYLQQDLLQVLLDDLTCRIPGSDPATRLQQHTRVDSLQHTVHNGCKLFEDLTVEHQLGEMWCPKTLQAAQLQHQDPSVTTETSPSSHLADTPPRQHTSATTSVLHRHNQPADNSDVLSSMMGRSCCRLL